MVNAVMSFFEPKRERTAQSWLGQGAVHGDHSAGALRTHCVCNLDKLQGQHMCNEGALQAHLGGTGGALRASAGTMALFRFAITTAAAFHSSTQTTKTCLRIVRSEPFQELWCRRLRTALDTLVDETAIDFDLAFECQPRVSAHRAEGLLQRDPCMSAGIPDTVAHGQCAPQPFVCSLCSHRPSPVLPVKTCCQVHNAPLLFIVSLGIVLEFACQQDEKFDCLSLTIP